MKILSILGSTGSIGTQTLEVVRNNQGVKVAALAARGSGVFQCGENHKTMCLSMNFFILKITISYPMCCYVN